MVFFSCSMDGTPWPWPDIWTHGASSTLPRQVRKKGSNRVSQSVSDSIIVSLLFCLLQPSRCRSSGHLFVMERQGRWHHVGLSDQWQPFGGVIKKKTFVLGVIPNHHFFLPAGNSFHQELFSPCHM